MTTTVRRTLASELIKLRSLRTYVWLTAVAGAFTLVLGPIQSVGPVLGAPGGEGGAGAVSLALAGATTAALLVGILGVLVVTGEYTPRAMRTTFTTVPRRGYVVVAKALALGLVTAAVSLVTVVAAVSLTLWILTYADIHVGWGSAHVLRVAAGTVWHLVGWGVLGAAAGWVTRSKIGGAALLLGVMLVLPPVLGLVPAVGGVLAGVLPSSAGAAMISTDGAAGLGFLLWTGYLVLFTALSAWIVSRRDA